MNECLDRVVQVRALGDSKIASMEDSKIFRKGIVMLEWYALFIVSSAYLYEYNVTRMLAARTLNVCDVALSHARGVFTGSIVR